MCRPASAKGSSGRRENDRPEAVSQARASNAEAARHEYSRLLYVAMTRAKSRLIVCGMTGRPPRNDGTPVIPKGCWYELIRDALTDYSDLIPAEDGDGTMLRFQKSTLPDIPTKSGEARGETEQPEMARAPGHRRRQPRHRHHAIRRIGRRRTLCRLTLVFRPRKRAVARHAGASPGAIASRHCAGFSRGCRAALSRARRKRHARQKPAMKSRRRFLAYSTIRDSSRSSHPAAVLKFRSSGVSHEARTWWYLVRSTGWL